MDNAHSPSIVDWLRDQPRSSRAVLGLFLCAVIACYVPHLIVAATGQWINNLSMWAVMGIYILVLMVQGSIGALFRRHLAAAAVFAVAWFVFYLVFVAGHKKLEYWRLWWMVLFIPPAASLLNGYLLSRYWRLAHLEPEASLARGPSSALG